ncbi:MAG: carboxypeptidase-like regulatory domain-containing protein, partial [Bacteroidota bacterium]
MPTYLKLPLAKQGYFFTLVTIVFFSFSAPLSAQISGRIMAEDGEPVAFANVLLLRAADTSFVAGSNSAEDGTFHLPSPGNGDYFLQASRLGFLAADGTVFTLNLEQNKWEEPDLLLR